MAEVRRTERNDLSTVRHIGLLLASIRFNKDYGSNAGSYPALASKPRFIPGLFLLRIFSYIVFMIDTETRFATHTEIRDLFALEYPNFGIRVIGELPDGHKAGNAWVIVGVEIVEPQAGAAFNTVIVTARWV